jgi:hypothetical protein
MSSKGTSKDSYQTPDTLVINVPPKLRNDRKENYVKKIQLLNAAVKSSKLKSYFYR